MDYVLGIDSGGTKFLVKAVGMDGRELAEYEGHPAGLYRFSRNEAVRTIQDNLDRLHRVRTEQQRQDRALRGLASLYLRG